MRPPAAALALLAALVLPPLVGHRPQDPDDGRAGTVTDRQGLATLQPAGADRWTPIQSELVLLPGDRIRTGLRGPNAVEIALAGTGDGTLLIGPGTLLELGRRTVHLVHGELEVVPGGAPVQVRGPGGFERRLETRSVLRADETRTVPLATDPRWLTGYRATTTGEWMGSLVAEIDGRDVALAIEKHLVDVVIRDAVAETTIDQVYANGTDQQLEGEFTFPLPPDASVSGFAMWVDGEMVAADIVERTRAREIYEELKARKKDPGLLEWSGGNLFTARVWPIPANGEKRVRIRYTQVLPLEGRTIRYRTALRSEATREHPVREVRATIRVASSRELASVTSPTHEMLRDVSTNAATLQWSAQELSPQRDLEVRIELARADPVTVVEHVRGDEGWFMVLLAPPGDDGAWVRETVPETAPRELCVIADTSGSMDVAAREAQRDLIAALLASLGADDRFRLLAADQQAVWFRPEAAAPAAADDAIQFLDERASLGWSDLDLAFATALSACGDGALLVYVGDGMVTTGDADAQAFATRLARLADGHRVTAHAVTTSNAFDPVVLDAIARIGGGSRRQLDGEPAATALSLLVDAFGPSLKDATVAIDGVATARVYPRVHPNVPAGRQRAVLGRFRPTDRRQTAEVVVEGRLRGEPVRWTRSVSFGAADDTASFLPRLWARRHADALLEEGPSPAAREEIVALSSEYGFMTPLTSFLVLEDEADRERYGVTRRVSMSDGERFFAEARETAQQEQLREVVREARAWRLSLREQALREIAGLGRDLYGWHVAYGEQARRRRAGLAGGELGALGDEPSFTGVTRDLSGPADRVPSVRTVRPEGTVEMPVSDRGAWSDEVSEFEEVAGLESKNVGLAFVRSRASGRSLTASAAWSSRQPESGGSLAAFGFPPLPPFVPAPPDRPAPAWPAAVLDALRKIDRTDALRTGGRSLALAITTTELHAPTGRTTAVSATHATLTPSGWIVERQPAGAGARTIGWLLADERGELVPPLALGRVRAAAPQEDERLPFALPGLATADVVAVFRDHSVGAVRDADGLLVIELRAPRPQRARTRLSIDRETGLIVELEYFADGRLEARTFVEEVEVVAGIAVPARVVHSDGDRRVTRTETVTATVLDDAARDARVAELRAAIERALVAPAEDPELETSFEALHAGAATPAQRLRIVAFLTALGRHERALETFAPLRRAPAADAIEWIGLRLLASSRRGDALAEALRELAVEVPVDGDAWFAAEAIRDDLGGQLGIHERLDLHDRLARCYRASAAPGAWRRWQSVRAQLLEGAGRPEDALAVRLELARDPAAAVDEVVAAANALAGLAQLDAAVQLLESAFARPEDWLDHELDQLAHQTVALLWRQHDLPGLTAFAERWMQAHPAAVTAHAVALSAAVFAGDEAAANARVQGLLDAELDLAEPADRARVQAAIDYLRGDGWQYHRRSLLPEDVPVLAQLARRLLEAERGPSLMAPIVADQRFARSDAGLALITELRAGLTDPAVVAKIDVERFAALALHVIDARELESERFDALCEAIRTRTFAAPDDHGRNVWSHAFVALCKARALEARAIDFLLARLEREPDADDAASIAIALVHLLAAEEWTEQVEERLLTLSARTVDPFLAEPSRIQAHAGVSRWTADRLVELRQAAELGDLAELEKLPRAERREREAAARETARAALAASFAAAAEDAEAAHAPWLRIESLCFAAETAADHATVVADAVALLERVADRDAENELWRALRERASLALAHVAVRRDAGAELADRVLAIYRERGAAEPLTLDWRTQEIRLLAALDRADALLDRLDEWIVPAHVDAELRRIRAQLLADQGQLDDAAADLTHVGEHAFLEPARWDMLAKLRLVLDDNRGFERARAARLDAMNPWELQQLAWQAVGDDRKKLDEQTAFALRAMLRKADEPAQFVWTVQNVYEQTKDFRALAALADGVTGHSDEATYRLLQQARGLIEQVHEEATLTSIRRAIADVATTERSAADRRALALLRYLVATRGSRVPHDGGAPGEIALAALREVGADAAMAPVPERVLLAQLLAGLSLPDGAAARTARRELLEVLLAGLAVGSREALDVADALARTLWTDGDRDAAIGALAAALTQRAAGDGLPIGALDHLDRAIAWWGELGRFTAAERFVVALAEGTAAEAARRGIEDRVFRVHAAALRHGGATSLGSGASLLQAAAERLRDRIASAPAHRLRELIDLHADLHAAATDHHRAAAATSLKAFVASTLPNVLGRLAHDHDDVVRRMANALENVAGPAAALALLVERCRSEPAWSARVARDTWGRFDHMIANLRVKAEPLGDELRTALAALVLDRLERDLTDLGGNRASIWRRDSGQFWAALRDDYIVTTQRVLELQADSAAIVRYVAAYLADGLDDLRAASRALRILEARGTLTLDDRATLAGWLLDLDEFAGAWDQISVLLAERTLVLPDRLAAIRALDGLDRTADARAMALETETMFEAADRFGEAAQAALAEACRRAGIHELAARWFEMAIHTRERVRPRGVDPQLAEWYGNWAIALAHLDRFDEAVEAAGAAVVRSGNDRSQRAHAQNSLYSVLERIDDLDAWIARHDARVADTGVDAPVIRSALGVVLADHANRPTDALVQFEKALALQPLDAETHDRIVALLDQLDRPAAAADARWRALRAHPSRLDWIEDLARRLTRLDRTEAAQRAWTDLVEHAPHEADGHRRLALHREAQERFEDSVTQWRQVVRTRPDDPENWLALALAQRRAGDDSAARTSLEHVLAEDWHERFGDVKARAAELLRKG